MLTDEERIGERTVPDSSEPECMTVFEGLMKVQTVDIRGTVAEHVAADGRFVGSLLRRRSAPLVPRGRFMVQESPPPHEMWT